MRRSKNGIGPLLDKYFFILLWAARRFYTEKRVLWAASLTFTTVFSLVPLLSVLFFVFDVFGSLGQLKYLIEPYIYQTLAPGAQEKVRGVINTIVNNIDYTTIGTVSIVILLVSVFLLMLEIEYALNEIWLTRNTMSIILRAAIYWSVLTIAPMLLALSLFFLTTLHSLAPVRFIQTYIRLDISHWLLYALICMAFAGMYFFMAGTRVRFVSALCGGILAGTFWKVAALGFTFYTSHLFYYPRIYGPLSAFPLLLLWLFLCWVLFLMGAEVSYLHQYYLFYRRGFRGNSLSRSQRESLTLLLFLHVAYRFLKNQPLPSFSSIADSLNMPPHITRDLAQPLLKNGLLATATNHAVKLMPGKPLESLTPAQILQSLDEDTPLHHQGRLSPEFAACHRILQSRSTALQTGDLTKSIKEILLGQHQ